MGSPFFPRTHRLIQYTAAELCGDTVEVMGPYPAYTMAAAIFIAAPCVYDISVRADL